MRTCGSDACCTSLGDYRGARQELAEAERITNRADLLYLVALFRADLKQEDGDLHGAAADAERAVAPRSGISVCADCVGAPERSAGT